MSSQTYVWSLALQVLASCAAGCWLCYLPLGKYPGGTAIGPPRAMVARAGQHRASSLLLALRAALPITTKMAYELPNTLLVTRTSSACELWLRALLALLVLLLLGHMSVRDDRCTTPHNGREDRT